MAILKKEVKAARESTSTHFPNETTQAPEDSDQSLLNHQVPETLIDPEDDEGGSTHFNNEEEYSSKSNRMNGGKTTAASKKAAPKHPGEVPLAKESKKKHPAITKAFADPDAPEAGEDADDDFGVGGEDSGTTVEADGDQESGLQDTQHMPNDEDPAAGYLTTGSDESPVEQVDLEGDNPQSGLEVEGGEGETPEAPVDEFDDTPVVEEGPEVIEDEAIEPAGNPEDMPLVDVDACDDEGEDVVFANVGNGVKAIKGNRIIASLSKGQAIKAGNGDVYQGDAFTEATYVEMATHGMRSGLKNMGFVFATVNLGKADVLNKRVEAKASKLTAAVRRQSAEAAAALEQCLAIAAVGINRSYFKDTRNELRAALESELEAAGVRNAKKMLARVFATKGIDFSKSILTVAQKLSTLSEEVRNQHVAALDMVGDEGMDDESEMFGDSASPDFQSEFAAPEAGADGEEFVDEFAEEGPAPETVSAALVRPAQRIRSQQQVSAKATGYSVTAAAILNGKAKLPWM